MQYWRPSVAQSIVKKAESLYQRAMACMCVWSRVIRYRYPYHACVPCVPEHHQRTFDPSLLGNRNQIHSLLYPTPLPTPTPPSSTLPLHEHRTDVDRLQTKLLRPRPIFLRPSSIYARTGRVRARAGGSKRNARALAPGGLNYEHFRLQIDSRKLPPVLMYSYPPVPCWGFIYFFIYLFSYLFCLRPCRLVLQIGSKAHFFGFIKAVCDSRMHTSGRFRCSMQ